MAVQVKGSAFDAVTVRPGDPRYADLAGRGSGRFAGKPDYVRLVCSTEHVVAAVQDAVRERRRVAVRSGGHCLEAFVADPAVRVVIDTSLMTGVSYDPEMRAFTIESGTRLGEAYRRLFLGWGVTIPAGVSPNVGIGGHVVGGGFGFLCRQFGLASDHLYGVEVVVVDDTGTAKHVTATQAAHCRISRLCVAALPFNKTGQLDAQERGNRQPALCREHASLAYRFLIERQCDVSGSRHAIHV